MSDKLPISVLTVGKGRIAMCRMPGAITPLDADVQALADLGTTCVLSLPPVQELYHAGAAGLPDALDAHEIEWHHLPIGDFGTPEPEQEADWEELSAELHDILDQGGTVAIHCRAGLGRTGMIALRLMVERGEEPQAALKRLRAARPGTVEREAQFDWAAQGYRAK